jgi:hypothetical protein
MRSKSGQADGWLLPAGDCRAYCEPVLVSACFLGIPCRWHGRRAKRRDALLARLKKKYVLVPVCPEQLGGMPTPRSGEYQRDALRRLTSLGRPFRLIAAPLG